MPFGNEVSRDYIGLLHLDIRIWLTDSCQGHSICRHIIEVQVHWRILSLWSHMIEGQVHLGVMGVYHCDWLITAYLPIPVGNSESVGSIESFDQNVRHGLTHLCKRCRLSSHIIDVRASLRSVSHRVGCQDTATVFVVKPQLSLPGIW